MGLFGKPREVTISIPMPLSEGYFYNLDNVYVYPTQAIPQGATLTLRPWNLNCMFSISHTELDGARVGLCFTSAFTVINAGGYLLTRMNRPGHATEYTALVRDEKIIIYNYPNHGALAISPRVSRSVQSFIKEQ